MRLNQVCPPKVRRMKGTCWVLYRTKAVVPVLLALAAPRARASAPYLSVIGGPTYAPGAGGYISSGLGGASTGVDLAGGAVGNSQRYGTTNQYLGRRPVRWDSSHAPVELGNLGLSLSGQASSYVYGVNSE